MLRVKGKDIADPELDSRKNILAGTGKLTPGSCLALCKRLTAELQEAAPLPVRVGQLTQAKRFEIQAESKLLPASTLP